MWAEASAFLTLCGFGVWRAEGVTEVVPHGCKHLPLVGADSGLFAGILLGIIFGVVAVPCLAFPVGRRILGLGCTFIVR